jgi:hypothetical protein
MPRDLKKPSLVDQESEGEPATTLGSDHAVCEVLLEFFAKTQCFLAYRIISVAKINRVSVSVRSFSYSACFTFKKTPLIARSRSYSPHSIRSINILRGCDPVLSSRAVSSDSSARSSRSASAMAPLPRGNQAKPAARVERGQIFC